MDSNRWCVYRHTFPDGKVYIGITQTEPETRWGNYGRGYQGQSKIFNAILAFGWNNIKHEILFTGLSEKEAGLKERQLINESDGQTGNYNTVFAKHEPNVVKKPKGNDAIISTESLWKNGKHVLDMPDYFYDRAFLKFGSRVYSVMLQEDHGTIGTVRNVDGGMEFKEYKVPYNHSGITFREAKEQIAKCGDDWIETKRSYVTHEQIERDIDEFKSLSNGAI